LNRGPTCLFLWGKKESYLNWMLWQEGINRSADIAMISKRKIDLEVKAKCSWLLK